MVEFFVPTKEVEVRDGTEVEAGKAWEHEMKGVSEDCAVTLVSATSEQLLEMAYYLAKRMDHRGPHMYGVMVFFKDQWMPLAQWVNERIKDADSGKLALSSDRGKEVWKVMIHGRYATSGNDSNEEAPRAEEDELVIPQGAMTPPLFNAQPFHEGEVYLAHNGNFPIDPETWFKLGLISDYDPDWSDSHCLTLALDEAPGETIREKIEYVLKRVPGSGSIVGEFRGASFAFREGNRPLHIAEWYDSAGQYCYAFVSEDSAFFEFEQMFGVSPNIREVQPGELVVVANNESQSFQLPPRNGFCSLELIYFSRGKSTGPETSTIEGIEINEYRYNWGKSLGDRVVQEGLNSEDTVLVSAFNGGDVYAEGAAESSNIRQVELFDRGKAVKTRSFLAKTPAERRQIAKAKFPVNLEVLRSLRGKRIVIVDDSLVSGNVSEAIRENIQEAVEKIKRGYDGVEADSDFDIAGVDFATGAPMFLNQCLLGVNLEQARLIFQKIYDRLGVLPTYDQMKELIAKELGYDRVYFPDFDEWLQVLAENSGIPTSQVGKKFCLNCMLKQGPIDMQLMHLNRTSSGINIPLHAGDSKDWWLLYLYKQFGYPIAPDYLAMGLSVPIGGLGIAAGQLN